MNIENLETEIIELDEHRMKWLFELEEGVLPSAEYRDQIFPLNVKAANFLWQYESDLRLGDFLTSIDEKFKEIRAFEFSKNKDKELKKWLFNLGIPFSNKVYVSIQPDSGFILTWKMLIKYSSNLFFAYDLIIWDKTLNWILFYDHNDVFKFGMNRIYNSAIEGEKMVQDRKLITEWNNKIKTSI
jgi:hypothetical protein